MRQREGCGLYLLSLSGWLLGFVAFHPSYFPESVMKWRVGVMHCLQCNHDNPDGAKFCGECGAKLERLCPNCGKSNPPINKFCYECGQRLTEPEVQPRSL